jgi:hypothetical protein
MQTSCPIWPPGAWSPVGYQVVEVAGEQLPGTEDAPQPGRHSPPRGGHSQPPVPRAAAGYRVVELANKEAAEEASPDPEDLWDRISRAEVAVLEAAQKSTERALPSPGRGAATTPRRRHRSPARWAALAAGFVLLLAGGVALANFLPVSRRGAVAVPSVAATAPAGGPACSARESPRASRETFGPSVAFVRSPAEAGRIAAREEKLTLLLHVSGNFEDAGFT